MTEAKINVATGFNGGVSVSVRADSTGELEQLLSSIAAQSAVSPTIAALFAPLGIVSTETGMAAATAIVQSAFPGAQPVSTVGQPLPQPGQPVVPPTTQPIATVTPIHAAVAPPTVPYPGDCPHGVRVYRDKPARGSAWLRWECALPFSPATKDSRCRPVNI